MEQINKIRLEKQIEYRRKTWLPQFFDKYKKYFQKEYQAGVKIVRFIKKNYLHDVVNKDELISTPGIFRYRVLLNNSLKLKDFDEDLLSFDSNSPFDYEEYILNQAIIKSLYDSSPNNPFYICLDLRLYGNNPKDPIVYNGNTYFLSNDQCNKIKKLWKKVNPATSSGVLVQQKLDFIKSLTKDIYG